MKTKNILRPLQYHQIAHNGVQYHWITGNTIEHQASMTNQNKFAYLLTTQSVNKNDAQFIIDAFDDR